MINETRRGETRYDTTRQPLNLLYISTTQNKHHITHHLYDYDTVHRLLRAATSHPDGDKQIGSVRSTAEADGTGEDGAGQAKLKLHTRILDCVAVCAMCMLVTTTAAVSAAVSVVLSSAQGNGVWRGSQISSETIDTHSSARFLLYNVLRDRLQIECALLNLNALHCTALHCTLR